MRRLVDLLISDRVVLPAILLNAVTLVALTQTAPDSAEARAWLAVERICIVLFVVEAGLKIRRRGFAGYWRSGWNRMDLLVTLVSVPALAPILAQDDLAGFLVLRVSRLFRLSRLLRFVPDIEHLVAGTQRALRASVGVFLALLILNAILAVGAMLGRRSEGAEGHGAGRDDVGEGPLPSADTRRRGPGRAGEAPSGPGVPPVLPRGWNDGTARRRPGDRGDPPGPRHGRRGAPVPP